ncbi:Aldo/keto reductase [Amylocarpus encephaloides]|uniref:Aldo/keto reductase n=1 Tax=Amylocarpus encephaloides TaxID=45428 RepID=A0A9P7Y7I0_9HELO|nr:Aldo/keto reductase [Amylocarpus encephaloides]
MVPKVSERIPSVGLGTFRLKGEVVQQPLRDAIRLGYRHIDTAAIYRNEKEIGSILQELYRDESNQLSRSDLWITSKLSPYDMENPRASLLQSLSALQTDYLDLYLIHWPAVVRKVPTNPMHKILRLEAWRALNEAKREGIVRNIGVSNFTPNHIQEFLHETDYGIQGIFVQMEIHPWYWRDAFEIQTKFSKHSLVLTGYALLAEGKLSNSSCPEILETIRERLGITRVQVILAWVLYKGWTILVKSEDVTHLEQNLAADKMVRLLTPEDCAAIDAISSEGEEEKRCWDPRAVV